MKKIYLTFILSVLSFQIANAQAPAIEWQNTIGGNKNEEVWSILQTNDGGYILGGYSASGISGDKTETNYGNANDIDIWVIKLDCCSGEIVWQNTIGGNNGDFLYSMAQTTDGGYILGGYSRSGISGDKTAEYKGGFDYWVVKLDSFGKVVWDRTVGGINDDNLFSIQQTADGGYILGGDSRSGISGDKTEANKGPNDYWIVKLDDTGTLEWENTIGGDGWDYLRSIQQTTDGGYILGGWSRSGISGDKTEESFEYYDYWVVKLDGTGQTIEWQNTIGGNKDDILYSIQQTTDGGYILGGFSQSGISGDKTEASQGGNAYWIIKLDDVGNVVWDKTIGGELTDILTSIQQTIDGGYILGGISDSGISGDKTEANQGGFDYWIVKLIGERLPKTINIPQDYSTIQDGIDASVNCDTVLVQPGTYYENINFNGKNIVLGSLFLTTNDTSYVSNTIIDGGNMERVVTINNGESNSTLLTGFTIRNGGSIEPAYNKNGGGIYCANSSPMFTHLIIKDNNVNARGGGIFLTGYFGSINNVTINNNIASNDGGAIYANLSDFTISESSISYNTSGGNGGGIYIQDCVEVNLISLVIFNNQTAAFDGGGICIENVSKTNIIQSTITGNSVPDRRYGGGIVISNIFSVVNIVNSIIYGNFNGPDYEAIILWSGQVNSNYSCILGLVDGGTRWPGEGMIYEDPDFESISDDNYYLSETSPCIETGTNFYLLMTCPPKVVPMFKLGYGKTIKESGYVKKAL